MKKRRILFIGLVWPEPGSSAAGSRMVQLVDLFVDAGFEVFFACAATKTAASYVFDGVRELQILLNSGSFDELVAQICPDIVMFDRFVTEEQYGWRVREVLPNALTVLDTEDLHALRHARQQAFRQQIDFHEDLLYNEVAQREIGAILRCDLSLIISEVEMEILSSQYSVSTSLCHYLPFMEKRLGPEDMLSWNSFEQRRDLLFIGNMLHAPNWDTVQILKKKVWPILRKRLPGAALHIYGAYGAAKVSQLHNPKEQFFVMGRAADAINVMNAYRILLAPIPYGAGLKGKFIDAMKAGTVSVTTTMGAEGMNGDLPWNGLATDDFEQLIAGTVALYQNREEWEGAQHNGVVLLNERFSTDEHATALLRRIDKILEDLKAHRNRNFIGRILQHDLLQRTKYLSLWIEQKNQV